MNKVRRIPKGLGWVLSVMLAIVVGLAVLMYGAVSGDLHQWMDDADGWLNSLAEDPTPKDKRRK